MKDLIRQFASLPDDKLKKLKVLLEFSKKVESDPPSGQGNRTLFKDGIVFNNNIVLKD